eukprot:TRINITY_DN5493_c1_g1_i1.p1 TRINITY_DN5493_c1_g1~~TRINITY_DN5493_c1_g1_i1.p1  ORF type:complete len:345 (-),score=54.00 TRINITY_DN5493_c1_g1_i1:173-1207(-)
MILRSSTSLSRFFPYVVCIAILFLFWYSTRCEICEEEDSICIPAFLNNFHQDFDTQIRQQIVYDVTKMLDYHVSPYQEIVVYDSEFFGKILVIDEEIMITERDETHYHEMIAHVPLNYMPDAKKVLIVGGGDGGTLGQVLAHPNIESATLVDIDEMVIRMSQKHFPKIAKSFSHPKARVLFEDGAKFVAREKMQAHGEGLYDVVIVDSTDFNRALTLFTADFYSNCKAILKEGGIFVINVESPSYSLNVVASSSQKLHPLFRNTHYFQVSIPTYLSGHYLFCMMSDEIHPYRSSIDWTKYQSKHITTHYYSPDVHYASFAIPNFVRKVIFSDPPHVQDINLTVS